MWLWILTGLNILISVHGFSNGNVPQSCESMIPNHASFVPNEDDPPYHITYEENSDEGLIRVSLHANGSNRFTGFMLQAREGGERAVGLFIPVDAEDTVLLNCNGPATAVTQSGRISRSVVSFDWQRPASESNGSIIFRATFVRSFTSFWVNVDLPLQTTAATSTEPSTAAGSTTPDLTNSVADGVPAPDSTITSADATTFQQTTAGPCIKKKCRRPVTVLMVVDSILVVLKMGFPIIIMATVTNSPLSRLLKRMSTAYCCVACEALEVAALVLSLICGYEQVFILLCVVVSINVTMVIFYFLPVGHSHELKKIKVVAQVFSVIHETFIVATIYVAILELVGAIENRRESWPLWVLIPYTAWILLFVIWFIVFYAQKDAILHRGKIGTYRPQREQRKKKHRAAAVTAVTSVFIGGAVAFGIAIIIGILQHPEY